MLWEYIAVPSYLMERFGCWFGLKACVRKTREQNKSNSVLTVFTERECFDYPAIISVTDYLVWRWAQQCNQYLGRSVKQLSSLVVVTSCHFWKIAVDTSSQAFGWWIFMCINSARFTNRNFVSASPVLLATAPQEALSDVHVFLCSKRQNHLVAA